MTLRRAWPLSALLIGGLLVCGAARAVDITGPASVQTSPAPPLTDKDKKQEADEVKQGGQVADQVAKQMKLCTDPKILDRVNKIGQRLAAVADTTQIPAGFGNDRVYPFTWHFNVVMDKNVNAFSLPGGYVYVNSGLLDMVRSDDELAGVLAHEITHSAHHHAVQLAHEQSHMNTNTFIALVAALLAHVPTDAIAQGAAFGQYAQMGELNNHYSEAAERDADHGGTIIMQKAGFNPVAMLTFMERLADLDKRSPDIDLGILRDHPYTEERVGLIRTELQQMNVPVTVEGVRQVAGGFRATVEPGVTTQTDRIVFDKTTVATLADPDGSRAHAAADLLNGLLDKGLQWNQVQARDAAVYASGHCVLTLTPADAALSAGQTPANLADAAGKVLTKGLWAQSIVVAEPTVD